MKNSRTLALFIGVMLLVVLVHTISYCQDTISVFQNFRNGESFLMFRYTGNTVQARTPLGGELIDYGQSSFNQRVLEYAPHITMSFGETETRFISERIPTMWWVYTYNTITTELSVKIYVPEFDAQWVFGNARDIDIALQENYKIQNLLDLWSQYK